MENIKQKAYAKTDIQSPYFSDSEQPNQPSQPLPRKYDEKIQVSLGQPHIQKKYKEEEIQLSQEEEIEDAIPIQEKKNELRSSNY